MGVSTQEQLAMHVCVDWHTAQTPTPLHSMAPNQRSRLGRTVSVSVNGKINKAIQKRDIDACKLILMYSGYGTIQSDRDLVIRHRVSCILCALQTSVTCLHAGVCLVQFCLSQQRLEWLGW